MISWLLIVTNLSCFFVLQSPYYDIPAFQAAGRDGLSTNFHGKHAQCTVILGQNFL